MVTEKKVSVKYKPLELNSKGGHVRESPREEFLRVPETAEEDTLHTA